jgi:hypothetical protein
MWISPRDEMAETRTGRPAAETIAPILMVPPVMMRRSFEMTSSPVILSAPGVAITEAWSLPPSTWREAPMIFSRVIVSPEIDLLRRQSLFKSG